jgi:cytochrome P450
MWLKTRHYGSVKLNSFSICIPKIKEDEQFDVENMVDDFITFFIAGQETTANTLAFTFLELGKNKEIVTKYVNKLSNVS